MDESTAARLVTAAGVAARVDRVERLSGGASRSTSTIHTTDGRRFICQVARNEGRAAERSVTMEMGLLQAAASAGVRVPTVHGFAEFDEELGGSWSITSYVDGEAIARRIQRDDRFETARSRFADDCGRELARIHSIDDSELLAGLDETDQVDAYRTVLDQLGHPSPAFELGLRWLDDHRPQVTGRSLVHGDFRLGNLLIDDDGLASVLDWELAHLGDPMEDLGWLCVRAWRFGGRPPVGGLGHLADLVAAYNTECEQLGRSAMATHDVVRWWIVLGTLKWGVMCVLQASRHLLDAGGSHEHAAIGRRVAENEWDVMQLIAAAESTEVSR